MLTSTGVGRKCFDCRSCQVLHKFVESMNAFVTARLSPLEEVDLLSTQSGGTRATISACATSINSQNTQGLWCLSVGSFG